MARWRLTYAAVIVMSALIAASGPARAQEREQAKGKPGCRTPELYEPLGEVTVNTDDAYRPAFSWEHIGGGGYMLHIFAGPEKERVFSKEYKPGKICRGGTCTVTPEAVPVTDDDTDERVYKWYRPGDIWWAVTVKCRGDYPDPAPEDLAWFYIEPCEGPELISPSDNITTVTPTFIWKHTGAEFYINKIYFKCPDYLDPKPEECYYVFMFDVEGNRICSGKGGEQRCYQPDPPICSGGTCRYRRQFCPDPDCTEVRDLYLLRGETYRWNLESWSYNRCGHQINPESTDLTFKIPNPDCPPPELYEPDGMSFIELGAQPVFRWSHSGAKSYKVGVHHPGGWVFYMPAYFYDWHEAADICDGSTCRLSGPPLSLMGEYFWWLVTLDPECGFRMQPGGQVERFTVY